VSVGIFLGIIANRRWFYVAGFILIVAGVFSPRPAGTVLFWIGFATMLAQVPITIWYRRNRRQKSPASS
jgi:hypothetical protein